MSVLYVVGSLREKVGENCVESFENETREFDFENCQYEERCPSYINFRYWKMEFRDKENERIKDNDDNVAINKACFTRSKDENCSGKEGVLVYKIKIRGKDNVDKIIKSIKRKVLNDDDFLNCITNSTDVCIKLDDKDSNKEKYTSIEYFVRGFLTAYRVPIREL